MCAIIKLESLTIVIITAGRFGYVPITENRERFILIRLSQTKLLLGWVVGIVVGIFVR